MKVLGISFGRKMKNTEILVKLALQGAEACGADVSFIRTTNLEIGHCTGCFACVVGMWQGKDIRCVRNDDYNQLAQAIQEADAIILGAPVYAVGSTGQLKNVIDRFGPAHDLYGMISEQERRRKNNLPLLDEKLLIRKPIGFISVGGAHTQNWVSLGLPTMKLFGFSTNMLPVDQIDAYDMGFRGHPLLDEELVSRTRRLGAGVAEAVNLPVNKVRWQGEPTLCPECHSNLIQPYDGLKVECAVCGIRGELSIVNNQIQVSFSDVERQRSRYQIGGLREHNQENEQMGAISRQKVEADAGLKDRIAALENYPGVH